MAKPGSSELQPGPPARVLAVLVPILAIGLVAVRATTTGLEATADDPVAPWVVAVVTVVAGFVLARRAYTQHTELGEAVLISRTLTSTLRVEWERVERLVVMRRTGLVTVQIHVRGLRRSSRLGAATRFAGDEDEVLDVLRSHPAAAAVLDDVEDDGIST